MSNATQVALTESGITPQQLGHVNGDVDFAARIETAIRTVEENKEQGKLAPEKIEELVEGVAKQDAFTITAMTYLRDAAGKDKAPIEAKTVEWKVVDGAIVPLVNPENAWSS